MGVDREQARARMSERDLEQIRDSLADYARHARGEAGGAGLFFGMASALLAELEQAEAERYEADCGELSVERALHLIAHGMESGQEIGEIIEARRARSASGKPLGFGPRDEGSSPSLATYSDAFDKVRNQQAALRKLEGKYLTVRGQLRVMEDQLQAAGARATNAENALAVLYGFDSLLVARVCDEKVDRSGALLGRVRARAALVAAGESDE